MLKLLVCVGLSDGKHIGGKKTAGIGQTATVAADNNEKDDEEDDDNGSSSGANNNSSSNKIRMNCKKDLFSSMIMCLCVQLCCAALTGESVVRVSFLLCA